MVSVLSPKEIATLNTALKAINCVPLGLWSKVIYVMMQWTINWDAIVTRLIHQTGIFKLFFLSFFSFPITPVSFYKNKKNLKADWDQKSNLVFVLIPGLLLSMEELVVVVFLCRGPHGVMRNVFSQEMRYGIYTKICTSISKCAAPMRIKMAVLSRLTMLGTLKLVMDHKVWEKNIQV